MGTESWRMKRIFKRWALRERAFQREGTAWAKGGRPGVQDGTEGNLSAAAQDAPYVCLQTVGLVFLPSPIPHVREHPAPALGLAQELGEDENNREACGRSLL